MNKSGYGIIGLALGICAVLTGTVALAVVSVLQGFIYLIVALVSGILITFVFCSKCPITDTCVHIIPGLLARAWPRRSGPYSRFDLVAVAILFAIIILPPQIALFTLPGTFGFFWICLSTAAILANRFLCPGCKNRFCPMKKGK
ncbi:MAG: hypothetical protein JXA44_10785 [Methanospirillaceae archaeon]|nr:hypothetical protein [Methanospirillaceae archaeon]